MGSCEGTKTSRSVVEENLNISKLTRTCDEFIITCHLEACGGYTRNLKVVCHITNFIIQYSPVKTKPIEIGNQFAISAFSLCVNYLNRMSDKAQIYLLPPEGVIQRS